MTGAVHISESKALIQAGWDDVPHLSAKDKSEILRSTLPHLRGARTKGNPTQGAGAVYPIDFEELECEPVVIPSYWRRCYAMDVGWRITAALWLAHDPSSDIVYAYTEHYRGNAGPETHVASIKARGEWIPGVIDPSARQRNPKDGDRLFAIYTTAPHSLKLTKAKNEVESGITLVYERMSTGRFKFFRGACPNAKREFQNYRRKMDEHQRGVIVKANDHLMDCVRYGVASGLALAITEPRPTFSGTHNPKNRGDRRVGY